MLNLLSLGQFLKKSSLMILCIEKTMVAKVIGEFNSISRL